jgi:hypothetical protein
MFNIDFLSILGLEPRTLGLKVQRSRPTELYTQIYLLILYNVYFFKLVNKNLDKIKLFSR